jgi:hypothetical protein
LHPDFRLTGRTEAVHKAQAIHDSRINREDADEDDDEYVDDEALRKQRAEEERVRLEAEEEEQKEARERPPELLAIVDNLENLFRKLVKLEKEVIDYQEKLDEPGHTEQFVERTTRLKQDTVTKLDVQLRKKLVAVIDAIKELNLEGEYAPRSIKVMLKSVSH